MDMLVVSGGRRLRGTVHVDGAKNSALPILASTLAIAAPVRLVGIPDLVDVSTMQSLLRSLGTRVEHVDDVCLEIDAEHARGGIAQYELVRQMRASICVLGPLLARFGSARVSLPGGCNIGHRPVDLHLRGLSAMGADVRIENGYIVAECRRLKGAELDLSGPFGATVTGTCNIMVAASLAHGRTIIRCAAREPEVVDLGRFLQRAGARIEGLGTSVIEVHGVDSLTGLEYQIVPDRIEAATLAIAAVTTRGEISIPNAPVSDMKSVLQVLEEVGARITVSESGLTVSGRASLNPTRFCAQPFPGIPTDCQAQLMALLTTVPGCSVVADAVFPERFMHVSELMRMGADIVQQRGEATINGGRRLSGADVMASDLRASAALVIAALSASGQSTVQRIYHLDRGYVRLEEKLSQLGADVTRVPGPSVRGPHFTDEIRQVRTDNAEKPGR